MKNMLFFRSIFFLMLFIGNVFGQNVSLGLPLGHNRLISSVNYSPDGKKILTSSWDGTVKIWDTKTSKLLHSIEVSTEIVNTVQFSPDGKTIVTASDDKTAKIWNAETGKLLHTLEGHTQSVFSAQYSIDGETILTASYDSIPRLWNSETGKKLHSLKGHTSSISFVQYSPDGKTIATASTDKTTKIWDAETGKSLHSLESHTGNVKSVQYSPNGKTIVTASEDKTAKIWDIKTGKLLHSLEGHTNKVNSAQYDPKGKTIVTSSWDGTAKIWEIKSGNLIQTLKGHIGYGCEYAEYSPNGKQILTSSLGYSTKIWDSETGEELNLLNGRYSKYSQNGKTILTVTKDKTVKIWSVNTGNILNTLEKEIYAINSVENSPDRKTIVTASNDKTAKIWDIETGKLLHTLEGHLDVVKYAQYSPNGKTIATTSDDKTAKIWDVETGELLNSLNGHTRFLYSLQYSPNGKSLVTASRDITAKIWNVENGKLLQSVREGNLYLVSSAQYSPDGKSIVVSGDWSPSVFSTEDGHEIHSLEGHSGQVNYAQYNPDGKTILTASYDKTAKIWNAKTGKLIYSLKGHTGDVVSASFSPNGKYIVTASDDKTAKIWDAKKGKLLFSLESHNRSVKNAKFSPDRKTILTNSYDWTAKIWDTETGKLLHTLVGHKGFVQFAEYINSKTIVTVSDDGSTIIWDAETGKIKVQIFGINKNGWLNLTKDKYYYGNKEAISKLYWIVNNTEIYPFEQFDLKYNRPDIVLSRIGKVDTTLINTYHKAYLKRLKKMNFTEEMLKDDFHIPEINIENFEEMPTITDSSTVDLNLKLEDSKYKLDRINIWVNDVAIYGVNGISLRDKNINNFTTRITVELIKGQNKVQVSVLNQAGAESYKETFQIECTAGKEKPDLYINVISVSEYQQKEMNLKYAVKDGRDIADMFIDVDRNQWANVYVDTLFNTNATIENVKALKEKLLQTDVNDQVILYVSGHGLLDDNLDFYFASHDVDFTNPKLRGISYESLEDLLDGIPARKKLFMMDACHSGEVDKDELIAVNTTNNTSGLKSGIKSYSYRGSTATKTNKAKGSKLGLQNSFELMQELFTNLNRGSGAVVISAAAGDSYALESSEWNNGVFTYAVINGLKNKEADANNDGEVTVSELRTYVIEQVQELTNGNQKPTSRQENVEFDFRVW